MQDESFFPTFSEKKSLSLLRPKETRFEELQLSYLCYFWYLFFFWPPVLSFLLSLLHQKFPVPLQLLLMSACNSYVLQIFLWSYSPCLCSPCSERPRLIKGRLSFLLKWLRPKIEHILFKSKSDYVFPSIKNPCQYAWTKLIQKDTFTPMFIAALFTIAKTRRQPNVHQQTNG